MTAISGIYSSTQYVAKPEDVLREWKYEAGTLGAASALTGGIVKALTTVDGLTTTACDAILKQFHGVWNNLHRDQPSDFPMKVWIERNFSKQATAWQEAVGMDKDARNAPITKKVRATLGKAAFLGIKSLPDTFGELKDAVKSASPGESDADRLVRGFRVALGIRTTGDMANVPALIDPDQIPEAMVSLGKEGCSALLQVLLAGFGPLEIEAAIAEYRAGTAQ